MAHLQSTAISGSFALPVQSGSLPGTIWFDTDLQAIKMLTGVYGCSTYTVQPAPSFYRTCQAAVGDSSTSLMFGGCSSPTQQFSNTEEYGVTSFQLPGAWAEGGALINARPGVGAGTQNAGLLAGNSPAPTIWRCTEEYDGSTWTAGGAISTGRFLNAGGGTQNAAFIVGGCTPSIQNFTEEYNGTSWASGGNLSAGDRAVHAAAGTQNAGLAFGGYNPPVTETTCTEEYDGSAWSVGGAMITAVRCHAGAGTQNAGLLFGGCTAPTRSAGTQEYDGSTWTVGGNMAVCRHALGGSGTQNSALATGGSTPSTSGATERYDGSIWAGDGNMINARYLHGAGGSGNDSFVAGGWAPSAIACTEEFTGGPNSSSVIAVWSEVAGMINARRSLSGAGSTTATLAIGGYTAPTVVGCTEEYDGSTWTAGGALINARCDFGAAGTQNAGLAFGGLTPALSCTEEYDGSAWADGGAMPATRYRNIGTGTQNAGLSVGGTPTSQTTLTYDGSTWSSGPNTGYNVTWGNNLGSATDAFVLSNSSPFALEFDGSAWTTYAKYTPATGVGDDIHSNGTSKQGLLLGGPSNTGQYANTFSNAVGYVGTCGAWASIPDLITPRTNLHAGFGTANAAVAAGGQNPAYTNATENWDGSTWAACGNMAITAGYRIGAGTQSSGLVFGALNPACSPSVVCATCTEEYNGASWSSGGALINYRYGHGGNGAGTQNATLAVGNSPTNFCTEEYDGSTWSEGGAYPRYPSCVASAGTQNDAIAWGGYTPSDDPPYEDLNTYSYDGTAWSGITRFLVGERCGFGTGPSSSNVFAATENRTALCFNGTTWSVIQPTIPNGFGKGFAGSGSDPLMFGGSGDGYRLEAEDPTLIKYEKRII